MKILITGGCGFIGSAVVRQLIEGTGHEVHCVDKLTYAATLDSISTVTGSDRFHFTHGDIGDRVAMAKVVEQFRPDAVMNLAAETHVDRSIDSPLSFVQSNIVATAQFLEVIRSYWIKLSEVERGSFRWLQVSTDEVYGSLGVEGCFTEESPYQPNSPYAASKAGADHLVRAWWKTYGLPVVWSHSCNNYGPYQFPEKLIPLMIRRAVEGRKLPIYGSGEQVRDWVFVEDNAAALIAILERGEVGQSYDVAGHHECTNRRLVEQICEILDQLLPDSPYRPHHHLMESVQDRPGHDFRYSIEGRKLRFELGWNPKVSFEEGLLRTVRWYLAHPQLFSSS